MGMIVVAMNDVCLQTVLRLWMQRKFLDKPKVTQKKRKSGGGIQM